MTDEEIDALSLLGMETEKCISCGFCESVCPTLSSSGYRSIYGARGRVILGKQLYDDIKSNGHSNLKISDSFYSCLDCYACVYACPAEVNAGKVSELARQIITEKRYVDFEEKPVAKMIATTAAIYKNPLGTMDKSAEWSD